MPSPRRSRSRSRERSRPERSRAELFDLYRIAVEEYRFQVITLNWNRTQYYLVLNVGILTVATGTFQLAPRIGPWVAAGLFAVGVLAASLSMVTVRVQHDYYRTARNHVGRIERELQIDRLGLRTTPGMASRTRTGLGRAARVTTVVYATLGLIAVLDAGGLVVALTA